MNHATVLCADDSADGREFVKQSLEVGDGGFRVVAAASRDEFEACIAQGGFDLALSEVNPFGFEDGQVIDAVRSRWPNMPVVILTDAGSDERAVALLKRGADDYVVRKPECMRRLPSTVAAVLAKRLAEREHLRAVRTLQDDAERLGSLSRQLLQSHEAERRRLARELHDDLGQSLSLLKINLQMLRDSWTAPEPPKRLGEAIELAARTVQFVRNLALSQKPSILDDLGLAEALRWCAARARDGMGIEVAVHANPPQERLSSEIETACFRIAQEALANVARHAAARRVDVRLQTADGAAEVEVADDGRGFDVAAARDRAVRGSSLGLLAMQERAMLAGGRLSIESEPGRGTTVRVSVPFRVAGSAAQA